VQNAPRDERSQLRRIADLERRLRVLETTPRSDYVFVPKLADGPPVNNSITLVDDAELFGAMDINATYVFRTFLIYDSPSSSTDLKLAFTVPAGASLIWVPNTLAASATTRTDSTDRKEIVGSGTSNLSGTIANAPVIISPHGVVLTGGTPGNLRLQWAQGVATVEDTVVRANSYLYMQRVA
jgi:hypothetical protein